MDSPWQEANVEVLKHLIPNNYTKFVWDIPRVCGVLEAGTNESTIFFYPTDPSLVGLFITASYQDIVLYMTRNELIEGLFPKLTKILVGNKAFEILSVFF